MTTLSPAQQGLILALAGGAWLRGERHLDGRKLFRLYREDRPGVAVPGEVVTDLLQRGLLASNMKFPAATFFLSADGRRLADGLRAVGRPGNLGPAGADES